MVRIGSPFPQISSVRSLETRKVSITWRNGLSEIIDLSPALNSHRSFVRLRTDNDLFSTVKIGDDRDTLVWADGSELTAVRIEEIAPGSISNEQFCSAMDEIELSLDGMAARLGIARRVIASYRKDKPFPPHVALAVRYLVERRRTLG